MRRVAWSIVLPVLASTCIYPSVGLSAPMRCNVTESSPLGGVVEVNTDDTVLAPPWPAGFPFGKGHPQIRWRPPPSLLSAQLVVGYVGSTLTDIGKDPSGGHIRFRVSAPRRADDTQVILSVPDSGTFTLKGDALQYGRDFGSDDESRPVMDVVFGPDAPSWPLVKSALLERGRLEVKLVRHGETITDVMFDLSNLEARDALVAAARHKVMEADPQVCTDAPLPVRRMF
jgi:hypothetical protein